MAIMNFMGVPLFQSGQFQQLVCDAGTQFFRMRDAEVSRSGRMREDVMAAARAAQSPPRSFQLLDNQLAVHGVIIPTIHHLATR